MEGHQKSKADGLLHDKGDIMKGGTTYTFVYSYECESALKVRKSINILKIIYKQLGRTILYRTLLIWN